MFPDLPGYEPVEQLHKGRRSTVVRSKRSVDGRSVILKALTAGDHQSQTAEDIRREYALGSKLSSPNVVRYLEIVEDEYGPVLVLEDFGALSLDAQIPDKGLPFREVINISLQLADGLTAIHRTDIVHCGVCPRNVVFNQKEGRAKLIDLGLAVERGTNSWDQSIETGDPLYIAPEQTGRMEGSVDRRTDFYSLGATLYRALTGHPPFEDEDPLVLMHSHMALAPTPPNKLRGETPPALSAIILKLLAKNPEDRYQTGPGLVADLRRSLNDLDRTGTARLFTLGQRDSQQRLEVPGQIFGREPELKAMELAAKLAQEGRTELVLVSGPAGIGKTRLVRELNIPGEQILMIEGKFDQVNRGIPYTGIALAFENFVQQILEQDELSIQNWRESILNALGKRGRVVVDVIPALEQLLGPQPPLPALPPVESQNRFQIVFATFARSITRDDSFMVLFLDDLQWADRASLSLLEKLVIDPELRPLLVVGTYRDNEVEPGHPLEISLTALKEAGFQPRHIELGPLGKEALINCLANALSRETGDVAPLAAILSARTGGNPFFLWQTIRELTSKALLYKKEGTSEGWQWDFEGITSEAVSDDVVELLVKTFQTLPLPVQEALSYAALLGRTFELSQLETISGRPAQQLENDFMAALDCGLVERGPGKALHFAHDRIQQSAYQLKDGATREELHRQIGWHLARNNGELTGQDLFLALNQLNRGRRLITQRAEQLELARLNLHAGKMAKEAMALTEALQHFCLATEGLGPDSWTEQHELNFDLCCETIEAEYLSANYEAAQRRIEECLKQQLHPLERAKLKKLQIMVLTQLPDYGLAIEIGATQLELLGVKLMDALSADVDPQTVLTLPTMDDPEKLIAMELMNTMIAPAYIQDQQRLLQLIFTMVQLSIRDGNSTASPYAYSLYGLLNISGGTVLTAYEFGKAAIQLVDELKAPAMRCRTLNIFNSCIRHWKEPLPDMIADVGVGMEAGLEHGDFENASYCAIHDCNNLLFSGAHLKRVNRLARKSLDVMEKLRQWYAISHLKITLQVVQNLAGHASDPKLLTGDAMDEEKLFKELTDAGSGTTLYWFHTAKVFLCTLFGDFDGALRQATLAKPFSNNALGLVSVGQSRFYEAIALLARHKSADPDVPYDTLNLADQRIGQLKSWAAEAPANFGHKLHLVIAEYARVKGDVSSAVEAYERAIDGAAGHGFVQEQAFALERYGEMWLSRGQERAAALLFDDAMALYSVWEAKAKVADLRQRKPITQRSSPDFIIEQDGRFDPRLFDAAVAIRGAQAVSGELSLEGLLSKTMQIVLQDAGAQWGVLLLGTGVDREAVTARTGADSIQVDISHSPEEASILIPDSIIECVNRSRQALVLKDASMDQRFNEDAEVIRRTVRSALCMPLLHMQQDHGLLYLENNLSSGVFTKKRVHLLQPLLIQAAITLQNARLITDLQRHRQQLEKLVAQRTIQLEVSNRELEDFVYSVSHDLRAPLRSISGFAQIIDRRHKTSLNKEGRHYFDNIIKASNQMGVLIDDLLKFSRLGRKAIKPVPIELDDVLQSTVETLSDQIKRTGARINLPKQMLAIQGDMTMAIHVFVNILENALKYHKPNEPPIIDMGTEVEDRHVIVSVSDNGIGIEPEYHDKIFKMFQRLHSQADYPGTGIGLAAVKKALQMMGGEVLVESELGKGSVFKIKLLKALPT